MPNIGEFDIIERYFKPLAGKEGLGLLDDAACLQPPDGQDLVVTKDMLAADVHFRTQDDPADIAWKALAVNVSDLVAKGAKPWLYFLGLGLTGQEDGEWLQSFAKGLGAAQKHLSIHLAGGDTIRSPGGLVLSVTAIGYCDKGQMLARSAAKIGDAIFATGTLGDAAFGLQQLKEKTCHDEDWGYLTQKYLRPTPPVSLGPRLKGLAHAAADISDGLIADLGHICKASHVGAKLFFDQIPMSKAALQQDATITELRMKAVTAGDDYELLFTAPRSQRAKIFTLCQELGLRISVIGAIIEGEGVSVVDENDNLISILQKGYMHFT